MLTINPSDGAPPDTLYKWLAIPLLNLFWPHYRRRIRLHIYVSYGLFGIAPHRRMLHARSKRLLQETDSLHRRNEPYFLNGWVCRLRLC